MTVVCIGTKCTRLETESTTVIIVSCPEDSRSSTTKSTLSVERGKREISCDKQVERGGDSLQLHAKGFVGRRRKWRY